MGSPYFGKVPYQILLGISRFDVWSHAASSALHGSAPAWYSALTQMHGEGLSAPPCGVLIMLPSPNRWPHVRGKQQVGVRSFGFRGLGCRYRVLGFGCTNYGRFLGYHCNTTPIFRVAHRGTILLITPRPRIAGSHQP